MEVVAIPASVTILGRNAFYDCNELKFVAIGSGVTKINPQAFCHCPKLMSVAIDNKPGLTIGDKAFKNCYSLINVSFFGNTPPTSFGYDCFYNCPISGYHVLEEYYDTYNSNSYMRGKVKAGPPYNEIWYTTNNGGTAGYSYKPEYRPKLNAYMGNHGVQFFNGNPPEFNYSRNCFYECQNLVSAVLPSSITYIGNSAFVYCTSLVSVSIPSTVTGIGDAAFSDCTSLQDILLPDRLNYIGTDAFSYCSGLQSIAIPNEVSAIPQNAFDNCCSLQLVTIGNGVTSIGRNAFYMCSSMQSVTFHSIPNVGQSAFHLCHGLYSRILDLTDSDKPYIGNSLDNYPSGGFTEAHYHGTLEPGEWGTITLPFKPSSYPGIVFFAIDNVDAASGTLTLSVAGNIEAGKPYLFRNQTDNAAFTLSASASGVPVNITAQTQTVGNFSLIGTFQTKELTETGLYEQQGSEFVNVGSLSIDPFRAYLKDNGGSAPETIVINCDDVAFVKITAQDDSTLTLYGLKKVEFIKQDNTPAVRVTRGDGSTATYLNPKKVDFGKD